MRSRFEAYSVIVEAGNPIPGLRNPIPRDEVFSYQPTAQAYINGEWRTILPNEIVLFRQEELLNTGICYNPIYANGTLLAGPPDGGPFLMSSIDIERWILASSFLRIPNQAHINSSVKSDPPANWDGFEYDDNRILWVILIFVSWVYGGLHVLAWNAPFHSSVETILWRFSAIAIMAYAIMLGLLTLYLHTTLDLRRRYFQSKGKHKYYMVAKILTYSFENLWYVVRGGSPSDCGCLDFFMVILNLAYMFGRAYLVVECFLNLFHSDPGMFQQPQWSVYFPHLG